MRKPFVCCFPIFLFFLCSSSVFAHTDEKDSLTLVDFFTTTNGIHWMHNTNWLSQKPVGKWYGVTVTGNRVTSLRLAGNGLSGSLPASFGNLTKLTEVVLPYNQIAGVLPVSIGRLAEVTDLNISYNELTGEIPESVKGMKSLLYLSLNSNHLTQTTNVDPFPKLMHNQYLDGDISYNNFTFDGIEYMVREIRGTSFFPQAMLHLQQSGTYLFVDAGGTLSNNTYYWYKVGESRYLTIHGDSAFLPSQPGLYYARIENRIAAGLHLYTDTVNYTGDMPAAMMNKDMPAAKNEQAAELFITPNPASREATLQTKSKVSLVLLSTTGALLQEMVVNTTGTLSVDRLPDGIYYLQNKTTGNTQKLVVHH